MGKVVWPDEVIDQIDQIVAYIEVFNPSAAQRMGRRLLELGNSLTSTPRRGRPAPHGTRELVTVRPYILRYEVRGEVVTILHVRHSSRRLID